MPARKKSPSSSLKMKIVVIFIIIALTASYAGMLFAGRDSGMPSASLFKSEAWMGFVPGEANFIRFLNYSEIRDLASIMPEKNRLYLYDIGYNLTAFDINYELNIEVGGADVIVYSVNSSVANQLVNAYSTSGQPSQPFNGIPIYLINASEALGTAWIAVHNGSVIYAEGNETSWAGVTKIINAIENPFFANESVKVGLLLASNMKPFFAMYYIKDPDPSLQIDWAIICLTNPVNPAGRQAFYFSTSEIAKNSYPAVASTYFSSASQANLAGNFIFG